MSSALISLADEVMAKSEKRGGVAKLEQNSFWDLDLKSIDLKDVQKLIDDQSLTKSYLVKMGIERFSIPKSKLLKLTIDGIRSEIRNAMMHEESIKIISQEAARSGTNRVS
jgi:hypothetical protein